jgi:C4-dicarboxylate-specific signal transduction histidine kinase
MVLRLRGTTAVPQLFVDCRQQLRFVKWLDNARIVADCSYPFGGIRFRMGSNKQTWDSDAIMHQPVPQGKAIYHLNRVAAMGQLAASLAHELSQPLAAIMSNAEAAQRFAGRPNPDMVEIREALDDITRDDKRARGVIEGMRSMLKKQSVVVEPVDLNTVVTSVAQMIRNEASLRGTTIELSLSPTAVTVQGDEIALQQVVLNLASNGLDAVLDTTAERRLILRTKIEQVAGVGAIWVEDNGPGVSAEVREKLFQPFFTTKTTGLGMDCRFASRSSSRWAGASISRIYP